jgi:hypothetical protein
VSGISSVIYIGAGANHSLAITNDGSVWAWGANNYGQIGIGSSVTTCATPMHIVKSAGGTLGNGVQVAGGSCHSVVLDSSGNVWTVGSSAQGQIGDGTTTTHRTAADIAGLLPASQIGAGGWSSYCIEANSSSTPFTAPGLLTSARNAEPQPAAPSTQDDSTAGASSAVAAAQSAPAAAAPDQSGQGAAASAAASSQAAAPDVGSGASVGTGAAGLATVAAIVDNLDQSATKRFQPLSGAWVTQALAGVANGAYAGGFAAAASSSGAETARARFSCSSLTAGQYDVYAWWPAMADNATHVAYDIHHAEGVTTVRVNQTERGGQWNLLGTFTFVGGSHVVDVQNSSSQPGASVCADAVKFVPAGK